MEYRIYQLDFFNGVHFGKGNLDSTEMTFHADTLFSALFQEALRLQKEEEFLSCVKEGELLFSDAFPYVGKCFYIPKPILSVKAEDDRNQGSSKEKKQFKNMKYIPQECLESFVAGDFPRNRLEELRELGAYSMKVSVGIRGNEEPKPYRVQAFHFRRGNGLYFIVGYRNERAEALFETLLEHLSYRGLGGKKSAGLGRFAYLKQEIPAELKDGLLKKGDCQMLLSAALPADEELEEVLEDSSYLLVRRSGFVDSDAYADQQMRKRELYVFAPGSCFARAFEGSVIEERNGGRHPVYRCAKALFLGVRI